MVPFYKESGVPTLRRKREVELAPHQEPAQVLSQRVISINLQMEQNATGLKV